MSLLPFLFLFFCFLLVLPVSRFPEILVIRNLFGVKRQVKEVKRGDIFVPSEITDHKEVDTVYYERILWIVKSSVFLDYSWF